MRTIDLGKFRKARVWMNTLPAARFTLGVERSVSIPALMSPPKVLFEAAIEIFVPLGPRAMYGLLGARFEARPSSELIISFGSTSAQGVILTDNIASRDDTVRVGLPAEYLDGVSKGIDVGSDDLAKFGAGKLTLNCAAHAEISSCEVMYTRLVQALLDLFSNGNVSMSDKELVAILSPSF